VAINDRHMLSLAQTRSTRQFVCRAGGNWMDVKQLQYFILVAEHGSFSIAAFSANVGQPAISRQIKALEEEVGSPLFLRNGRGIALTRAGRRLIDHAKDIVSRIESAKADLAEINHSISGKIALGLPPSIGSLLTTPLIKRFLNAYPAAQLSIVEGLSGHLHEWLLRGDLDLAAVYLPSVNTELFSEKLFTDNICLVSRPESGRIANTTDFKDISSLPLVLTSRAHSLRKKIEIIAQQQNVTLKIRCEIDSIESIKALVSEGYGHALLPVSLVRSELENGLLQSARVKNPDLKRDLLLVMSPRALSTPLMRTLRREIQQMMSNVAQ
jgi:LysR family nitrogen assimilation transcriptional regulator